MERHYASVSRFFANKVKRDYDDLTQATFLACLESIGRFRGEASFRTLLFAIARNKLLRALREIRRDQRRSCPEPELLVESASSSAPDFLLLLADGEERRLLEGLGRLLPDIHAVILDPSISSRGWWALILPPRFHMLRYHGVLAAHAKQRCRAGSGAERRGARGSELSSAFRCLWRISLRRATSGPAPGLGPAHQQGPPSTSAAERASSRRWSRGGARQPPADGRADNPGHVGRLSRWWGRSRRRWGTSRRRTRPRATSSATAWR